MNIEELRDYCILKKGVTESFPFDDKVLVFKVMNKMFALVNVEIADSVNLKCDPEHAQELRHIFSSVIPGYHMNKKHWNTILLNGELPKGEIERQIDHSYQLVVNKLPKKQRLLLTQDRASHK